MNTNTPTVVSRSDVFTCLIEDGWEPDKIHLKDAQGLLPTTNSMVGFGERLQTFLEGNGLYYVPETWDCDKYTVLAVALAMFDHAIWLRSSKIQAGLWFGEAWVVKDGVLHSLVIVIHAKDGILSPHYYEPQPTQKGSQTVCLAEVSPASFSARVFLRL